jgi:hypothetical protein
LEPLEPRLALTGNVPAPDHVVIVIEENHADTEIIGSAQAPYMNSLANDAYGAQFTQSFGVEHPSQPNYLDLFSGDNQGVTNDAVPTGLPFTTDNLGAELLANGKTFTGYSDGMPSAGYTAASYLKYQRKHNPWVNWQDSPTNGIPAALNQPFTAFPGDYTQLPTVSFVIPDQDHDMHDGTIKMADDWLQNNLDGYAQWAKTHNSLLILTWDEDDYSGNNQIATVFLGAQVVGGQYDETINHFDVLRTLEDMYGLGHAGASADATPITDIWHNNTPTLNAIPKPAGIKEDAATHTVNLAGISAGSSESQALTITAVSSNPALIPNPTVNYTSPSATGSLSYKPVANMSGTSKITVTVRDEGFDGVAGNADDASIVRSFVVSVAPVNDAPKLGTTSAATLKTISEDATNPPGTVVSTFVGSKITDVDAGALEGVAVIGLTQTTHGTWQFSIDAGATWTAIASASDTAALLLRPADRVRFLPAHDYNGTAQLQFRAWDQSNALAAGSVADTTGHRGGTGAYSTASLSAKLTITPVNDKPVLTLSGTLGYVHDTAAIKLAPSATMTDVDSLNFDTGKLTVSSGVLATNKLSIGIAFTVDGSGNVTQVSTNTVIGTVNAGGGTNGTDLVVTFNSAAKPYVVQSLIRAITFQTVGGSASQQKVTFKVTDGDGGTSIDQTVTVNVS